MALLRPDDDHGFSDWRLPHLPACSQRRKKTLEHRFSRQRLEKVYKIFERWGMGAVAIPALLPPPMPMVAFLFAAGSMQYPIRKFLTALTIGRSIRYTLLAFLAARYGRQIIAFITRHGHPTLLAIIGLIATATLLLLYFVLGKRQDVQSCN